MGLEECIINTDYHYIFEESYSKLTQQSRAIEDLAAIK